MKRVLMIVVLSLIVFFGIIFGIKFFILHLQKKFSVQFRNPIVTITATKAVTSQWNSSLDVVGSARTVKGVNVTTELAGMIVEIDFQAGQNVKKGDLLVKLDVAPDIAKLHALQAQATLDKITYYRDKKQYSFGAVSKEQLDTDFANMQSSADNVIEQQAMIDKKIIRAPFSGRLGIRLVNLGQYINAGDAITSLQTLDPIYVDFYLPEQEIQNVTVGQTVQITADRAPGKTFTAKITTINPVADESIRNVEVEATVPNPQEILLPGMFMNVHIGYGAPQTFITLPVLAVTFNPYGSLVYILKKTTQMHNNQPVWKAEQQFVDTGDTRGNQIAVLKGIAVGDMVVTSGQMKLKNGSLVTINNNLAPSDNPNPVVPER